VPGQVGEDQALPALPPSPAVKQTPFGTWGVDAGSEAAREQGKGSG